MHKDFNPYFLNTPAGVIDLRIGMESLRSLRPEDPCSRQTAVAPSDKCEFDFLYYVGRLFCGNNELIEYVQSICGFILLGGIEQKALFIAHGSDQDGKSAFWGALSRVLGSYSCRLSAEKLLYRSESSRSTAKAEIGGTRLMLLEEFPEGARLSDEIFKKLTSGDEFFATKKPQIPVPVLITDSIPDYSSVEALASSHIYLIPFRAYHTGESDAKDYSERVFSRMGESFLKWCVQGAKKVIDADFHLTVPECAKKGYRVPMSKRDLFVGFLAEKCMMSDDIVASSYSIYKAYRDYCREKGEAPVSKCVFCETMREEGYEHFVFEHRHYYRGVWLAEDPDNNLE